MSAEHVSNIPESLRERMTILNSHVERVKAEKLKAQAFLQETIFPSLIEEKLALGADSGSGLASSLDIWRDIIVESALVDLFWNINFLGFVSDEEGMRDIYSAWALSVEMLPTGVVILRGGTEASKSILTLDEWRKSKRLQRTAFNKVFKNPKENILFPVEVNMPPAYE